ncbi:chorismate-binding protein [Virgibacillus halophilus]|uniref:Chorismate-binding protein n=1 Tax=Tigheibacillus halophilus TaxID=361280 RepID=A0ABU5C2L6_9BACI|nr:chorismate-binding protein [Virgibacillus halophilus]
MDPKTTDIASLQYAWEDVLAHAEVFNSSSQAGTGLVAMGGMAFDPLKERTQLWENYPDQSMRIPEFVLTKSTDGCYLTCNIKVKPDDHSQQLANMIRAKEKELLSVKRSSSSDAITVISRKEINPEAWKRTVAQATEAIKNGEAQKIVLAREVRLKLSARANITSVLERLTESQPNSYVFAIEHGKDCFVGATPERLVKLDEGKLLSTCLAGTAPRGSDMTQDEAIGKALLQDPKNLQEHDFVVQMIKKSDRTLYKKHDSTGKTGIVQTKKPAAFIYTCRS